MAVNFTFGQDIASSLDRTLSRGQQSRQFAARLARRLEQDAFNNKIRRLGARIKQKRLQLDQEKEERLMVQQAIENEQARRQMELLEALRGAQVKNIESLIENRGREDGSEGTNSGAVITALQNLFPQGRNISKQLREAEQQFLEDEQILNSSETPEERKAALANLIKSRGNLSALQSRAENISNIINQLNSQLGINIDATDVFSPGSGENTEAAGQAEQPQSINSSVFE